MINLGFFADFGTLGSGERIYRVEEIASILECSERTVRDAIQDAYDPLPAVNIGRGADRANYRIFESDLLTWMRRRQRKESGNPREIPTRNVSGHTPMPSSSDAVGGSFKARRAIRNSEKG